MLVLILLLCTNSWPCTIEFRQQLWVRGVFAIGLRELLCVVPKKSVQRLEVDSSLNSDFLGGIDFNLLKNKIFHSKMNILYKISSQQRLHRLHILIIITSFSSSQILQVKGINQLKCPKISVELRSLGIFLLRHGTVMHILDSTDTSASMLKKGQ